MAGQPLRIAVWHNLPSGGAKRALHDHVRGLVARGHHVEAWCPPQAHRDYLPLSEYVTEHVVGLDIPIPRRVRALHRLGVGSHTKRVLAAVEAHCRAAAELIGDDWDVLLSATCQFSAVPPLAAHVRVPSVLYLQEPNRPLYEALPELPWLDGRRRAREAAVAATSELASIRAFDRVLVNSRFSRESVLRAFAVDADVCYLGVDTEVFQPATDAARGYFVGLGSISRAKGVEGVLAALAATTERPPLIWVGNIVESESYVHHVAALAASLGLSVELRRAISDRELVGLLQNARALLYAPRLEPFGYAPLEANACGTPVIAIAEGGVRETVADGVNGLLVDDDAFSATISRLWRNPAEASALGRTGRAHAVEHWSLPSAIDRLETRLRLEARMT